MKMPNESAPPIRELPDEIEAAITAFHEASSWEGMAVDRGDPWGAHSDAEKRLDELRHTIRAALDNQDAALRERCERLRQDILRRVPILHPPATIEQIEQARSDLLQPGDLADNLRPRGEDAG